MTESDDETPTNTPKYHAPKDKKCQYCGKAFTSSSLGRHLDLYIKPKNPKAADGVHDVEEIRRLRGNITRRQPRASLGRTVSTPVGRVSNVAAKKDDSTDSELQRSPSQADVPNLPKDGQYLVDSRLSKWPFSPGWENTGVINNIPSKTPEASQSTDVDASQDTTTDKRPGLQRQVSRQMLQKAQFDAKHKLSDAMDTARAAELALREVVSSWRAAKVHIDNDSMPFDFDPLSLDFPALTLQCLRPPPTLFSSTQHPTSTSWSVQYPGQREFEALSAFFQARFKEWKTTCATATTAATEDLMYPPRDGPRQRTQDAVKRAEKQADVLEKQVKEHLDSAYAVWDDLPQERRHELWVLELARSVGKKHKEAESLKKERHSSQQEISHLKAQIEQLSRLQQPREFKMSTPSTIPLDPELISQILSPGVKNGRGVGFNVEDRHVDLNEAITRVIQRWKTVITTSRAASGGMSAQRGLDQAPAASPEQPPQQPQHQHQQPSSQALPQSQLPPTPQRIALQRTSTNTSFTGLTEQRAHSTSGPPSTQSSEQDADGDADPDADDDAADVDGDGDEDGDMDGEMDAEGDADGEVDVNVEPDVDADMGDDSFTMLGTPSAKPPPPHPLQTQATLDVPRTRGPMQHQHQHQRVNGESYVMQNGSPATTNSRAHINMSRSMPNMQAAMPTPNNMHVADIGMVGMPGMRGGDPMYMD